MSYNAGDCQAEFDQYISPDGEVYQFEQVADRFLLSFANYGMPEIEYLTQRGPYQHGETLLDYRLKPRIVQLIHRRNAERRQKYWEARADILNLVRPNRQIVPGQTRLGVLRKTLPDGARRDLDVLIMAGPMFGPRNLEQWDEFSFQEELRFWAGDPTFYDPAPATVTWVVEVLAGKIYYSASALTELKYPYYYGLDVISGTVSVTYAGTWLAYPTIEFVGPLNQPDVENTTTGEHIQLDYNIANGETVTVALPFGNKTVTNNFGANLVGYVTTDSDLATFHLAPDPEAAGGVNVINASGGGGIAGVTQIRMHWYTRYIGI